MRKKELENEVDKLKQKISQLEQDLLEVKHRTIINIDKKNHSFFPSFHEYAPIDKIIEMVLDYLGLEIKELPQNEKYKLMEKHDENKGDSR